MEMTNKVIKISMTQQMLTLSHNDITQFPYPTCILPSLSELFHSNGNKMMGTQGVKNV